MTITDRQGNVPEGLGIKAPCSVATTGNITLSGLQTIDGVTLIANQRVLVWQQTDQTTNGIYQASTGNWTRPNDVNNNESFIKGTEVVVTAGSTYAGEQFYVTCSDDPIVIGTSLLTWAILPATIAAGTITYAKIQKVTASRLLGNPVGSPASGTVAEINLGATFAIAGSNTLQTVALTGDVTTVSNSFATTIANGAVTYAKLQNVTASRLLGNPVGSPASGVVAEITLGATFSLTGSTTLVTLSGTGDVTWASNSFATTIAPAAVTLAKMSSLTGSCFIANNTGAPATPLAVTATSAAAMLASITAPLNATLGNPTGTASASGGVMMGFGSTAKLTPSFSTKALVIFTGAFSNNTTSGGGEVQLRFSSSTAPSNQSALTGTTVGGLIPGSGALANQFIPYTLPNIVTGLTPGTQYWFDVALVALTGGTVSLINNQVTIHEVL